MILDHFFVRTDSIVEVDVNQLRTILNCLDLPSLNGDYVVVEYLPAVRDLDLAENSPLKASCAISEYIPAVLNLHRFFPCAAGQNASVRTGPMGPTHVLKARGQHVHPFFSD